MEYGRGSVSGLTDRWGFWAVETDGLGRTTEYDRNLDGTVSKVIYPDGDCVEYVYDDDGNKVIETRMALSQCILVPDLRDPDQLQRWIWTYESRFNQMKSEHDPKGNRTDYLYDYEVGAAEAGNLVQITYPEVDEEEAPWSGPQSILCTTNGG